MRDVQALERKLALKVRDGAVDVVILVLADSRQHRQLLEHHRAALRGLLPLDNAQVRRALRAARLPEASGIVMV